MNIKMGPWKDWTILGWKNGFFRVRRFAGYDVAAAVCARPPAEGSGWAVWPPGDAKPLDQGPESGETGRIAAEAALRAIGVPVGAILETLPIVDDDAGQVVCPFCGGRSGHERMEDINHADGCAWLIASEQAAEAPPDVRDPRHHPREHDVVRTLDGQVYVVSDAEAAIVTIDRPGSILVISLDTWREWTRSATALYQDDAMPPADVSLLAKANRALAQQVEDARRVLLALADACGRAVPGETHSRAALRALEGVDVALGLDGCGWDETAAALRKLCGVSDA